MADDKNDIAKLGVGIEAHGFKQVETSLKSVASGIGKLEKIMQVAAAAMGQSNLLLAKSTEGATAAEIKHAEKIYETSRALYLEERAAKQVTKAYNEQFKAKQKINVESGRQQQPTSDYSLRTAAQANRFNTGNIAAQFQDIAVTSAMNMNPLTIGLQQGTQLVYILQQSKAPLADFAAGLKNLFSPLTMVTVGLTALIAAGIQMVDWVNVGKTTLNGLASAFDWISDNASAIAAGIGLITTSVLALNASAIAAGVSILLLKARMLVLTALIGVINGLIIALNVMTSAWFLVPAIVIGAIEAFAYFKDNVKSFLDDAIDFVIDFVNKAIGYFKGLGEVIKEIPEILKTAWNDGLKVANNKITEIMNKNMSEKYINADEIKETVNSAVDVAANGVLKVNKAINDSVKSMSEAASKGLKSMADGLGKNTKDAEKLQKAIEKVGEAYENAIFSNQVKIQDLKFDKSIKSLTEEQKIIAQVNYEYKKQLDTLERKAQAENLELKLFDEYKGKLKQQAEEEINIRLETYKNEEAQKAWNSAMDYGSSLTKSFFSDLKSGLQEGQSAWEAFSNAVLKMLDKIADKMMDLAIDAAFDSLKQGQNGKSNNLMSSIVDWTSTAVMSAFGYENTGGIKGTVNPASAEFASTVGIKPAIPAAQGGVFSNGIYSSPTMFKFAKGGKFGVMGEAGPEAVMPLHRSPDGSLGVRADGMGGSSPVVVNVINNSNARATTQQRQTEQGTTIDVIIDEMVAQKLGQQGTASNQALTAFNNRQLVAR